MPTVLRQADYRINLSSCEVALSHGDTTERNKNLLQQYVMLKICLPFQKQGNYYSHLNIEPYPVWKCRQSGKVYWMSVTTETSQPTYPNKTNILKPSKIQG
ncbi:hypothetical protein PoB_001873100 [Plakobranchus ocellatus]|uniref:Uncharacterized protein n=1 Tax=Plakobranchus ocellatus TaxID=259542 RepID=A0AAV3YYT1_9GAST|nr:hypothetical protein PoB_001873100 [Plakobranchus ocellatus]